MDSSKQTNKKKNSVKQDQLSIDVTEAVSGVDAVLNKIIQDRSVWNDFFKNPAKILAEAGYSKPRSDEDNRKYNRIFYAILTNEPLMAHIHSQDFCPQMSAEQVDTFHDDLRSTGAVTYDAGVDVDIIRRMLNNPSAFKKLLTLSIHAINDEGVFEKRYTKPEIDKTVAKIMANAKAGNSFAELSDVSPWQADEGDASGGLNRIMAVIPPAVAVPAVAEAVVCGTVACVVVPLAKTGTAKQSLETLSASALGGDRDSIHALKTVGLLIEFISELAAHTRNIEKVLRAAD